MSKEIERAVDAFAADMRAVLLQPKNMGKKPQWPDMAIQPRTAADDSLIGRMRIAIDKLEHLPYLCPPIHIMRYSVDLGNYAMMIYDNARRQYLAERGEVTR
jgi:hypothetical protein